jgi:ADP-ribosylation factor GTPase-activating protein 2/3
MDAKSPVLTTNEKAHQILKKILSLPENNCCFECGAFAPVWASVNNGIFICFSCSGLHRSFGVNYSFVRSTTIDNWSNLQLQMMISGGNKLLKEYLEEKGIPIDKKNIDAKYKRKECEQYREKAYFHFSYILIL